MFYTEFDSLLPEDKKGITFYPEKYAKQIDEVNSWVYDTVNNGSVPTPHIPLYFSLTSIDCSCVGCINVVSQQLKRHMRIMYSHYSNL